MTEDFEATLLRMLERSRQHDPSLLDEVDGMLKELSESIASFIPKGLKIRDGATIDHVLLQYQAMMRMYMYLLPLPGVEMEVTTILQRLIQAAYWLGRRDQWIEKNLEGIEMEGGEND